MPCVLCKNAETKSRTVGGKARAVCPICGEILFSPIDAQLCYGDKKSKRADVLFAVSDRYIFVHKLKGFERTIYALGIIGGIILAAIVRTVKEKRMPYSFVDLNDVDHIIAPYRNKKYKKDDVMKVIMKDGTDFIIKTSQITIMPTAQFLKEKGIPLIDGSDKNYGETFCERPFFRPDAIGRSVAPSAASKIKMLKKNFVAPAVAHTCVTSTSAAAAPQAQPQPQPQQQPKASPVADEPPYRAASAVPSTVAELGLRVMTYSVLSKAGINYVSQLTELTARDLRGFGAGEMAIDEIQQALASFGLSLKTIAEVKRENSSQPIITPPPAPAPKATEVTDEPPYQPVRKKDPNVKFCRKCGEKLRRDDVFCPECGADQR